MSDQDKKVDGVITEKKIFVKSRPIIMFGESIFDLISQVDSDDLPLNVSRETLQQHKLLKVSLCHSK